MIEPPSEICPGCKIRLPPNSDSTHPYLGASPSCWKLFGEVLAREYSNPYLMQVHRLTVDAYAAQHPGTESRRSTQSVWLHLTGLYLTLERGHSHDFARRIIGRVAADSGPLSWLTPPDDPGSITVLDVAPVVDPESHTHNVGLWAAAVWHAWRPHHGVVSDLAERAVADLQADHSPSSHCTARPVRSDASRGRQS